ncbi:MAG: hypothetical protein KGJ21_07730, partial [Pseudomonadota bacterium]|nr:hypothetical protein [Pseudomonadota bacterium]
LAVRLRKLSQAMGEEARRRFIEATQADTRPPIKIHTIEEKKEDKEADQSGWRETPITSASMAEKRWEKLAQFQQECPSYPTFDEVQEHLCKSYMPETFLPILEDIVKKQHNRIDRILADSTSMAGAKEETRRRISDHLHDKQFWLARINKIFIEDRIGLDDSFDWSLYRAVINASGSDKTQAEAINTKLTRQGQKQFQLRVLECVLQNNDLPAALKKSVENHIEFFKRRISYRPQKLQEIEEQEKAETKRSKKEKASEAEKHKGVLSEDTKTALDAMRRPGEFGAEHSWFEKLYQDRHNKDDSKKPTK